MGKTAIDVLDESFYINENKIYTEIAGSNPDVHGLLMNARFIQGIFDDQSGRERYARFGYDKFDPEENTNRLIQALPEWYSYGLRAFTVGFQGGGPCFTIDNSTIHNNPFGSDGTTLDAAYANRMDRLIRAADELGMVVIVSFLYVAQASRLKNGKAIVNAVRTGSRFLKEQGYTNVMIEVCNEHDITNSKSLSHPLIYTDEGIVTLMEIAKEVSGGMLVGCSKMGGKISREVCEASDVILIHGNGCSRQEYYNLIQKAREYAPGKPIVCNEDSQAIGQLEVALKTKTSWGYYNNMTKQEPPADWGITKGEDQFFAYRMAQGIGIKIPNIPEEEQYYLQGFEPHMVVGKNRWIRVASLYPETINYVDFYCNEELAYTCYDEPFAVDFQANWKQGERKVTLGDQWKAVIYLRNGKTIEKNVSVQ